MAKEKITAGPVVIETSLGETVEHLTRRVSREMLWVVVSAVVSVALGLLAGNLFKF
ncbi:hypothetical protein [Desulfotomaculum copahuensis]|uniref:hypothetical protein n=1 Tax=Desulfotomaculum copahuensis TaxID=1838280 RepID=UPI000AD7B81D|nr:hypothetical protein [Desulfotomaculum copahuensis]